VILRNARCSFQVKEELFANWRFVNQRFNGLHNLMAATLVTAPLNPARRAASRCCRDRS